MEKEIWKPVKGYEGLYEVSNKGNIKSLNYNKTGNEKVLRPADNGRGYLYVVISKNGERKNMLIHRAVAEVFLENPYNLPQVNHRDEDKTNNSVENIEFCSCKYNLEYSKVSQKAVEVTSKPVIQFTKDGRFVSEYKNIREAERYTGIHHNQISRCCLGRKHYKSAGNYKWKFKDE